MLEGAMPRIELIQFPGAGRLESLSPFCVKAQRILNYKRLSYAVRNVTLPPRRGINPAGKLPVLRYDIETVPDSTAIALFLEERHPDPALVGPAGNARPMGLLLEDWADEALYWMLLYVRWKFPENATRMKALFTAMLPLPLSLVAPRIVERQVLRGLHAQGMGRLERVRFLAELRRVLTALDALAAQREFLSGPALGLGDIAVFAMLHGLREAPLAHGVGEVDAFPDLLRWYLRVDDLTAPPGPY
jgi:glutathione S-transferase